MSGDNGRLKMPPQGERMIQLPGEDHMPPGPGMPRGMSPGIQTAYIDTSKPPVMIQASFYLPPGIPDVPPDGVFWHTRSGGLVLSPLAGAPVRVLAPGEKPPDGANDVLDEDERSEHQALNVVMEEES
jgi:hypothetical protein